MPAESASHTQDRKNRGQIVVNLLIAQRHPHSSNNPLVTD
jgi:hypothetical protein